MQALSWNQADIADMYGQDSARFPDTDSTWEELVTANWWYGDWCFGFLDPKGARYYLPAAMICNLLGDYRVDAENPLRRPGGTFGDVEETLSESQILAIRSFIRRSAELAASNDLDSEFEAWIEIQNEWSSYYASPKLPNP